MWFTLGQNAGETFGKIFLGAYRIVCKGLEDTA